MVLLRMAKRKNIVVIQKIAYIGSRKHTFRVYKTVFLHKTDVLVILVVFLAIPTPKRSKPSRFTNM